MEIARRPIGQQLAITSRFTYLCGDADECVADLTARKTCGSQGGCTDTGARQCGFAGELGETFRAEMLACKSDTGWGSSTGRPP